MPDAVMGEHIGKQGPGPSQKTIKRGWHGKPAQDLPVKKFFGYIGEIVDDFYKIDEHKYQRIHRKQKHKGIVILS